MKTQSKIVILSILFCCFALYNCKKESDTPAPDTRTAKELIVLSPWKLTASISATPVDIDGINGPSTDVFSQLKLCETDNTFKFNNDSTITEVNNTKCKSNEAPTYKGSWLMSKDYKTLTWDGFDYTILEMSATRMTLKYSFTLGANTYQLTDTYSH